MRRFHRILPDSCQHRRNIRLGIDIGAISTIRPNGLTFPIAGLLGGSHQRGSKVLCLPLAARPLTTPSVRSIWKYMPRLSNRSAPRDTKMPSGPVGAAARRCAARLRAAGLADRREAASRLGRGDAECGRSKALCCVPRKLGAVSPREGQRCALGACGALCWP